MWIKIKKYNPEVVSLKKLLDSEGMTFDEVAKSPELIKALGGVNLTEEDIPELQEIWVNMNKVFAVDPRLTDVPGFPGKLGFSIWPSQKASDAWMIPEEYLKGIEIILNNDK